jgi:hypothetical protein
MISGRTMHLQECREQHLVRRGGVVADSRSADCTAGCVLFSGNHIRLMLPTLRRQINEALEARSAELAGYGPPLDLGSEAERCGSTAAGGGGGEGGVKPRLLRCCGMDFPWTWASRQRRGVTRQKHCWG